MLLKKMAKGKRKNMKLDCFKLERVTLWLYWSTKDVPEGETDHLFLFFFFFWVGENRWLSTCQGERQVRFSQSTLSFNYILIQNQPWSANKIFLVKLYFEEKKKIINFWCFNGISFYNFFSDFRNKIFINIL